MIIKSTEEIKKMRVAGKLAARVLEMITPFVKKDVTTLELNEICHNYIVNDLQAIPAPLNYRGFPKSICTSVNHVVCHGIPSDKKLKDGDIINIDVTVIKNGFHADTSKMFTIGKPSILAKRLIETTQLCLYEAIKILKPGISLNMIGNTIEPIANKNNFSVVRDYCGHGIGSNFHEPPNVLHYATKNSDTILKPGMIFTIEPMINAGKNKITLLPDKWTVITKDRSLSAQWEHTILITETSCEILTKREDES